MQPTFDAEALPTQSTFVRSRGSFRLLRIGSIAACIPICLAVFLASWFSASPWGWIAGYISVSAAAFLLVKLVCLVHQPFRRLAIAIAAPCAISVIVASQWFCTYTVRWVRDSTRYHDTYDRFGRISHRRMEVYHDSEMDYLYLVTWGPMTQSIKPHGHWYSTAPMTSKIHDQWFWYGEEVSEGEFATRNSD